MAMEKWYQRSGEQDDIIVSTRVRLARNVADLPFPGKMTDGQREELAKRAEQALEGQALRRLDLAKLPRYEALGLAQRHLVSLEFAEQGKGTLFVSQDESVSIMVGEEDHLRIQVLAPGLDTAGALARAQQLDSVLEQQMNYAFHEKLGYLTACPTNLGTALRVSAMLHLSGLEQAGAIRGLIGSVSKLGLTIRGAYGEGTKAEGSLYQLSNQITLGISEEQAAENVKNIAKELTAKERQARQRLFADTDAAEDRIWRAYGTLANARLLSSQECRPLISALRAGVSQGILPGVKVSTVNEMMMNEGSGALMTAHKRELNARERDRERARVMRTLLTEN